MTTHAGLYGPEALLDAAGRPRRLTNVVVYQADGTTPAVLYTDRTKSTQLTSNAVQTTSDALLSFYAAPGMYVIRWVTAGTTHTATVEVPVDYADVGSGPGSAVTSVFGRIGDVVLAKADVLATGLAPGDIGAATAAAVTSEQARAQGVEATKADLVGGVVPLAQIPPAAFELVQNVATVSAMLALSVGGKGALVRVADDGDGSPALFLLPAGADPTNESHWVEVSMDAEGAAAAALASAQSYTNSAVASRQPLDSDLTAIAALDATSAGALATDGAGWIRKTYAQLKAALGITTSDVSGLGSAATHAATDFDTSGAATSAVATHVAATDPHADRAYTDAKVAALVNSAPSILDTLGEIATQLQSDESAATALATTVAGKQNVVVHGSTASTARPGGATVVHWIGSVAPTNATTNDEWTDTTVPVVKRWTGSAWVSLTGASATLADRGNWATTTVYVVGDVVTQGGHRYVANTAHTAGATFAGDAAKWTQLSLEPVSSVNGLTGAVSVPDVSTALLGQVNGAPISPATTPPAIGPELWVLANLLTGAGYNSATLSPSITANGTAQTKRTICALGNTSNQDTAYRVKVNVASMTTTGWSSVSLRIVDSGGNVVAGTNQQRVSVRNDGWTGGGWIPYEMDFKVGAWGAGTLYLEVFIEVFNNATTGTLAVDSISVREVASPQRPILYGAEFTGGGTSYPELFTPLFDPVSNTWKAVVTLLGPDGALTNALQGAGGYSVDSPFRHDGPDPTFAAATASVSVAQTRSTEILLATGEFSRSLRIGNNDQILEVQKADLSYELRGNTHGGETVRGSVTWRADTGSGWAAATITEKQLRPARRFQMVLPTQIARSAPDSDTFANIDHTATFFPDGVTRMDRTTTFLKAVRLRTHFDWMSSHDTATPAIGRIGAGLLVIDEVDVFPKVAAPVIGAAATATTGGTLAAATYAYQVTAIGAGGESTPSATVTQATTGTTSTVTVNWTASPNALGHRIYGRTNGTGAVALLATVGATTATWIDDGSAVPTGQQPPTVNKARRLDQASIATDSATSDRATWSVWYDPIIGIAYGNVFDRDSVLARTGVAGVKTRLEGVSGSIRKNYINTYWTGDGNPSLPSSETAAIASGTVWTATHWWFTYCPADPVNYHLEIAARAASITQLKTLYPAT